MKVQTFEEWLDEKSADWRENAPDSVITLMRDAWQATVTLGVCDAIP